MVEIILCDSCQKYECKSNRVTECANYIRGTYCNECENLKWFPADPFVCSIPGIDKNSLVYFGPEEKCINPPKKWGFKEPCPNYIKKKG